MLQAKLLGTPLLRIEEQTLALSGKTLALVAYLAVVQQAVPRSQLAELLWGPEGGVNLRQALYALRKQPGAAWWLQDGSEVAVLAHSDLALLQQAWHSQDWMRVLQLSQSPLLQGLEDWVPASYRDWLEIERRRLEDWRREALWSLAQEPNHSNSPAAIAWLQELLELDPYSENAHRKLIEIYLKQGDRAAAQAQYERCRQALWRELGLEPSAQTQALLNQVAPPLLATLSSQQLRLLRAVAVLQHPDAEVLAQMLELAVFEVLEGLETLEGAGLLQQGLLTLEKRQEVLQSTPRNVLELLNRRAALSLDGATPQVLAQHWLYSGQPDKAVPFLLQSAQQALQQNRIAEASLAYMQTLWAPAKPKQQVQALLGLEGLAARQGLREWRWFLLNKLEQQVWELQDDNIAFEVSSRQAAERMQSGVPQEALQHAQKAQDIARRLGQLDLQEQAQLLLGGAMLALGQHQAAHQALSQVAQSNNPAVRLRAQANLGIIAGTLGQYEQAVAHHERSLTLARQLGQTALVGATLNNLAGSLERLARYPEATQLFREAYFLHKQAADKRLQGMALLNLSHLHLLQGHYGPAWNTLQEALEDVEALNYAQLEGGLWAARGLLLGQLGQVSEAQAAYSKALGIHQKSSNQRALGMAQFNQALMLGEWEQAQNAIAALRQSNNQDLADKSELELALWQPQASATWLSALVQRFEGSPNPHQAWIATLIAWRIKPAASLEQRLRYGLQHYRFAEAPLAWFWLGQTEQYQQSLLEQAEGLPKNLRAHFEQHPRYGFLTGH